MPIRNAEALPCMRFHPNYFMPLKMNEIRFISAPRALEYIGH